MVTTLVPRHSSVGRASAALSWLILLVAFSVNAQDWNTNFGGRSERTGLTSLVGPTTPRIAWSQTLTAAFGLPPFVENNRVVTSRIGALGAPPNDPPSTTWIVAQDLKTGAQQWSVQLPRNFPDSWYSSVIGMRDGQVYASRASNANSEYVYALNAATGAIVWRSQSLVTEAGAGEGDAFAPNGDLIHGSFQSVIRLNHTNGQTVWESPRGCPASGGCAAAVLGSKVYVFDTHLFYPSTFQLVVAVFDVNTGARLYSSPVLVSHDGSMINQLGLFVGPDGTVYSPLGPGIGGQLVAIQDTGTALVEKWRVPMGATAYASFGVGPDGTILNYNSSNQVVRLAAATGAVLNTSAVIPHGSGFDARITVDAANHVYLATSSGVLYYLDATLTTRWSVNVSNLGYGGPAIAASKGVPQGFTYLLVAGDGAQLLAYVQPVSPGPCKGPSGDCNPPGPGGD